MFPIQLFMTKKKSYKQLSSINISYINGDKMSHEAHIAEIQTRIDNLNGIITKITAQKSWVDSLSATTPAEFNTALSSASTDVTDRIFPIGESTTVSGTITYLSTTFGDEITTLNAELSLLQSDKAELEALENGTWTEADSAWQANPTWRSGD